MDYFVYYFLHSTEDKIGSEKVFCTPPQLEVILF